MFSLKYVLLLFIQVFVYQQAEGLCVNETHTFTHSIKDFSSLVLSHNITGDFRVETSNETNVITLIVYGDIKNTFVVSSEVMDHIWNLDLKSMPIDYRHPTVAPTDAPTDAPTEEVY